MCGSADPAAGRLIFPLAPRAASRPASCRRRLLEVGKARRVLGGGHGRLLRSRRGSVRVRSAALGMGLGCGSRARPRRTSLSYAARPSEPGCPCKITAFARDDRVRHGVPGRSCGVVCLFDARPPLTSLRACLGRPGVRSPPSIPGQPTRRTRAYPKRPGSVRRRVTCAHGPAPRTHVRRASSASGKARPKCPDCGRTAAARAGRRA
jgi:hypothetical protein